MANFKKTMTSDEFKKAFVEHLKDNNLYNAFKSGLELNFSVPLDYSTFCKEVAKKGHITLNTGEEVKVNDNEDEIALLLAGEYSDNTDALTNFATHLHAISREIVETTNPNVEDLELYYKVINSNLKKRVDDFASIYKINLDFTNLSDYTFIYRAYPELEATITYDQQDILTTVDKSHLINLIEEKNKEEDYDM